jgi:hypothetical protein
LVSVAEKGKKCNVLKNFNKVFENADILEEDTGKMTLGSKKFLE